MIHSDFEGVSVLLVEEMERSSFCLQQLPISVDVKVRVEEGFDSVSSQHQRFD